MVTAEKENTESVFTYTASGQRYTKAVTAAVTATDAESSVITATTAIIPAAGWNLNSAPLQTHKTTITCYVYDGYGVLFETDITGTVTALNHRGTNLYARTSYPGSNGTGNITAYYLYNAHGDVEELIDAASGTTLASYTYDAFGTQLKAEETDTFKNTVTYRGYEFDSDTGLYYLNARYYDSETARFLTEDTYRGEKDDPLSLNLYGYCAGNPVKYADPSGNIIITATAAVTMLVISALTCGLVGEIACVFDQCYTEDGWDFSDYDIGKTATALVTSGTRGAADCAIAFCAGGIAIKVGQELATELGVQAGTRLFAAVSSGFAGAFTGSVSGAGARMAEALTYNAVCDLIGCPEYKMSFDDRIAYSWNPDAICMDALLGFCSYAANAAYSFKPAYNQGICTSDAGKAVSEGGKYLNIDEGLNFSNKAAEHMGDSTRKVPVQTLQEVIKQGNAFPDPRGSNATMYCSKMYINKKMYNIEVLYDKATNTVYHFEYARKTMGNLPAIK